MQGLKASAEMTSGRVTCVSSYTAFAQSCQHINPPITLHHTHF